MKTYQEFISSSEARREAGTWTVYLDPENNRGKVLNCCGETEYEAKEDAWRFYQDLVSEIKKA